MAYFLVEYTVNGKTNKIHFNVSEYETVEARAKREIELKEGKNVDYKIVSCIKSPLDTQD